MLVHASTIFSYNVDIYCSLFNSLQLLYVWYILLNIQLSSTSMLINTAQYLSVFSNSIYLRNNIEARAIYFDTYVKAILYLIVWNCRWQYEIQ